MVLPECLGSEQEIPDKTELSQTTLKDLAISTGSCYKVCREKKSGAVKYKQGLKQLSSSRVSKFGL